MNTITQLQTELNELRQVRDSQVQEITRMRSEIRELRRRQRDSPDDDRPLRGLKLAVIGPSFRRQNYVDLLEPLGPQLIVLASEDKVGRIEHACSKVHGILYITTFGAHQIDDNLNPLVDRTGVPITRLSFKGLDRLEEAVVAMREDMQAYKDLLGESKSREPIAIG